MTGLTLPSSVATVIQLGLQPQQQENGLDKSGDLNPLLRSFGFLSDAPAAPQAMLIEDVLPLEGLPFIGGQSSAGKTFVAVLMATCLATDTRSSGVRSRNVWAALLSPPKGGPCCPTVSAPH